MSPTSVSRPVRDFRSLWFGQSVSFIGDYVSLFVLPTVAVLELRASSFQVGALTAIATIAYPTLGLFVGVVMDRVRRRPTMIIADAIRLVVFVSLPVAAALGVLSLTQLFIVAGIAGACTVLFDVAYRSYLPTLLHDAELAKGNARLEMSNAIAKFAGPSLGGGLLQAFGPVGALSANALSFLASIAGMLLIRTREPRPESNTPGTRVCAEIGEGARFLWRHPLLRPLTVSASLRNLGMNAKNTVLLLYLYQGLHVSSGIAGAVFTVGAVAAIVGAVSCSQIIRRLGVGSTLLLTSVEGFIWLLVPLTLIWSPLSILMVIMFGSSLWVPVWNATIITIRQNVTDSCLLGRVNATARTINLSTIPIGALAGGLVAQLFGGFGTRGGLVIALCVCTTVATLSVTQLANPKIRLLSSFPSAASLGSELASSKKADLQ